MFWKDVFRRDYQSKITESRNEYSKFRRTNEIHHLQQACNKLFRAIEIYLILKYNQRHINYQRVHDIASSDEILRDMVSSNAHDRLILVEANQLHRFYNDAELQMDMYDAETLYKNTLTKFMNRLR